MSGLIATHVSPWIEGIRNLPQNPLANYFLLTRSRQWQRMKLHQRYGPLLFGLFLFALFLTVMLYTQQFTGTIPDAEEITALAIVATLIVAVIGIGKAFYDGSMVCLSLLSGELKPQRFVLDDSLAHTMISDREVVLAALRIAIEPIARYIAVIAFSTWFIFYMLASDGLSDFGRNEAINTLVAMPAVVIGMTVSGTIAALINLLAMVALGTGNSRSAVHGVAAGVYTLSQFVLAISMLVYYGAAMGGMAGSSFFSEYLGIEELLTYIVVAALFTGMIFILFKAAASGQAMRKIVLFGTPLLYPASMALMALFIGIMNFGFFFSTEIEDVIFSAIAWCWGALSCFNLIGIQDILSMAFGTYSIWKTLVNTVPFWILQFVLVFVAFHFAARAVSQRRHSLA